MSISPWSEYIKRKCTLRLKSSPAPTGDPPLSAAVLSGGCRSDGELGDTVAGSAEARLKLRGPLTPAIPLPSSCRSAVSYHFLLLGRGSQKRPSDLGASHQHLPFQKAVHSPFGAESPSLRFVLFFTVLCFRFGLFVVLPQIKNVSKTIVVHCEATAAW